MGRPKGVDWGAALEDYLTGSYTKTQIGRKYGVSASAVNNKAKRDNWDAIKRVRDMDVGGADGTKDCLSRVLEVGQKLLVRIELMSDDTDLSAKDLKMLSGALRDIHAVFVVSSGSAPEAQIGGIILIPPRTDGADGE